MVATMCVGLINKNMSDIFAAASWVLIDARRLAGAKTELQMVGLEGLRLLLLGLRSGPNGLRKGRGLLQRARETLVDGDLMSRPVFMEVAGP